MVYRLFRLNCIFRILLICASILLFFYLVLETDLYATTVIVGAVSILQIYALLRYVEETNRALTRFLLSIRYSDFTQSFRSSMKGAGFEDLNEAFTEVVREFQKARMEKEEHFRYLQTVVQHIEVGVLAFNANGDIELLNSAAKRLLKISFLRNLKDLVSVSPVLVEKLETIQPRQNVQVKLSDDEEPRLLSIRATGFIMHQRKYTLVSLQNIQSELEEKEMEAWQTLIRTLTHEIMNSITPISSLAATANQLLKDSVENDGNGEPSEAMEDVLNAIGTIEKRSQGLIHFVEDYRKLTRIPRPRLDQVPVVELFDSVANLMQRQIDAAGIDLQVTIDPESLELMVDPDLIEQVLINLTKNAIEAVHDLPDKRIELKAWMDRKGRSILQVIDNGPGIAPEMAEKIFIPFFTTKREGSGVGLSLSKQIMRLHRGHISVTSEPGEETCFTLRF